MGSGFFVAADGALSADGLKSNIDSGCGSFFTATVAGAAAEEGDGSGLLKEGIGAFGFAAASGLGADSIF